MRFHQPRVCLIPLLLAAMTGLALDLPATITNIVKVQLIQTALDDGSDPAPVFDPVRHPMVAAAVNRIFAQAGMGIEFAPGLLRWNDTAAHQGDPATYEGGRRPSFDLIAQIVFGAHNDGVASLHANSLSLFFVGVCPDNRPGDTAGVATIAQNGMAIHFEAAVVENQPQLAAVMIAHEICHNLGLYHLVSEGNLMTRLVRDTSTALTTEQIAALLSTNAIHSAVAHIPPGGTGFLHADSDGDGLTDEFEGNTGLDANNPLDADLDLDGDALSNRGEYLAGTDIHSASSTLRIDSLRLTASGVIVAFPTKRAYPYRLQMRNGLEDSPWTTVLDVIGSGTVITVTNQTGADVPARLYRVVVPR